MIRPNKAIHPGNVIFRSLRREGMTQANLCQRTGLSEKHISQIINGEASITVETALLLENVLGGSASFWISLEKNYQEDKARIERTHQMRNESGLVSKFPYTELVKRGFVEQTRNNERKVENLWKFFGVNSLEAIPFTESIAYRKRNGAKIKSEHIAAWLRCGELEAKQKIVSEFSETNLRESLGGLRKLTIEEPKVYSNKIDEILSQSGVVVSYIPHFPGTGVNGSVRWVGNIPLIQLSLLGATADSFWFTLFHEIGHLLLHGKKGKFIEFESSKNNNAPGEKAVEEIEADNFAGDILVPKEEYSIFIKKGDLSNE